MKLFLLFLCIGSVATEANEQAKATPATLFDVIHYDAQIEPDLAKKNVAGRVLIKLKQPSMIWPPLSLTVAT